MTVATWQAAAGVGHGQAASSRAAARSLAQTSRKLLTLPFAPPFDPAPAPRSATKCSARWRPPPRRRRRWWTRCCRWVRSAAGGGHAAAQGSQRRGCGSGCIHLPPPATWRPSPPACLRATADGIACLCPSLTSHAAVQRRGHHRLPVWVQGRRQGAARGAPVRRGHGGWAGLRCWLSAGCGCLMRFACWARWVGLGAARHGASRHRAGRCPGRWPVCKSPPDLAHA